MSLILAHWTPKGAVVVADTLLANGVGGMGSFAPKIHMISEGPDAWIVGFTGSTVSATWMLRELMHTPSSCAPEDALMAAFDRVIGRCGSTAAGEFPRTGVTTVLVSRKGIVVLDGCGFIKTDHPDGFVALGCGEEYATGWWNAKCRYAGRITSDGILVEQTSMLALMESAKHHFPGIGGETTVLRLKWT